jgi:glycosyltransferase involved in cell wall biosynthesis
MNISVIIPTRNNGLRLADRLRPLFHQTLPADEFEIVVVDNGSSDNTDRVLRQLSEEATNLRWVTEPAVGRARARNRGIWEARNELIVFLDDDIDVSPDHLVQHRTYHMHDPERLAVIGRVVDTSPINPVWLKDYFHARQVAGSGRSKEHSPDVPLGLRFATGIVSLLRDTLEHVRIESERDESALYFDPSFIIREDGDLGCRLVKAGVRFVFADDIVGYHHHPRTWQAIKARSYEAGYDWVRLLGKHPEVAAAARRMTAPRLNHLGLLAACVGLFVPAFLIRHRWPEPMRKVVGGLLLYQANRGYRQALKDRDQVE